MTRPVCLLSTARFPSCRHIVAFTLSQRSPNAAATSRTRHRVACSARAGVLALSAGADSIQYPVSGHALILGQHSGAHNGSGRVRRKSRGYTTVSTLRIACGRTVHIMDKLINRPSHSSSVNSLLSLATMLHYGVRVRRAQEPKKKWPAQPEGRSRTGKY